MVVAGLLWIAAAGVGFWWAQRVKAINARHGALVEEAAMPDASEHRGRVPLWAAFIGVGLGFVFARSLSEAPVAIATAVLITALSAGVALSMTLTPAPPGT